MKIKMKNKKINLVLILVILVVMLVFLKYNLSFVVLDVINFNLKNINVDEHCLNKIALQQCHNMGFTHKYVVSYDEENKELVYRCAIKEEEVIKFQQFLLHLDKKILKECKE